MRCWIISPFYDFCCFRCVTHCISPLTSVLTDVLYIYISCFITITKFLCSWSIINRLLSTAIKTLNLKYFWVRTQDFDLYGSRDVIGTWSSDSARALSYWWSMMTMRLSWMGTKIRGFKDFGSRVSLFGVTWGHRSRDHLTRHMWFPIGGLL